MPLDWSTWLAADRLLLVHELELSISEVSLNFFTWFVATGESCVMRLESPVWHLVLPARLSWLQGQTGVIYGRLSSTSFGRAFIELDWPSRKVAGGSLAWPSSLGRQSTSMNSPSESSLQFGVAGGVQRASSASAVKQEADRR